MPESIIFPVRVPRALKYWMIAAPVLAGAVVVLLLFIAIRTHEPGPLFALPFWFAISAWFGYWALAIPRAVVLRSDDVLEFPSAFRVRTIAIADLIRIEPIQSQFGFLRFRSSVRSVIVLMHLDGLHRLLTIIEAKNSDVEMLGC
jgi:hypothetical protein